MKQGKNFKSETKSGEKTGKHEKAKRNHLNTKQPKGNKGNNRWSDYSDEY